jgi:hypothetical protein
MCRAIDAAYKVDEVKGIRDAATALEQCARIAKNKEAVRRCGEIRLRAERKAGGLLAEMEKATGARGSGSNQHKVVRSNGATAHKLADLGITESQSSQWQQVAKIPEEAFAAAIAKAVVLTKNGLLKKPRREQRERELGEAITASTRLGSKLYGVIYADPPWDVGPYSHETGMDRAAVNHYPTMPTSEIKATRCRRPRMLCCSSGPSPMLPGGLES